ncbi:hypothetical protein [Nocardia gamkensis]|uniref:hypothetical protein n=1 Tax=Nocardia gamkensis TaxID=352869 RepID=UPI0037C76F07
MLIPGRALDPLADPEDAHRRLIRLRDAGATVVTCAVRASDAGHYCDQLAALHSVATALRHPTKGYRPWTTRD